MLKKPYEHPFVTYLIQKIGPDRAARAVLRRTLGRAAGEVPDAFRYVVPWLPKACSSHVEEVYYLIAGLYAYHPAHIPNGNMGAHLLDLAGGDEKNKTYDRLEHRLVAALRAHPDDLPDHLRRLIGILKAKDRPVNWHALMGDLLTWDHPDLRAKKRWAEAFWGRGGSEKVSDTEKIESNANLSED